MKAIVNHSHMTTLEDPKEYFDELMETDQSLTDTILGVREVLRYLQNKRTRVEMPEHHVAMNQGSHQSYAPDENTYDEFLASALKYRYPRNPARKYQIVKY